ncbi:MAG: sulfur carrier protein ThiS [Candidatus Latescibacterota bacterium]
MKLTVNDKMHEGPDGMSLEALIAELGFSGRKGMAAAVNATVIPAQNWGRHLLSEGDGVLIIQATQGG